MAELQTDRLLLREFRSSDLDAFRRYVQSEHHWRSTPDGPPTIEQVKDLIRHFALTQANDPRAEFHLAAIDRLSNEFVGAVDLAMFAPWRQGTLGWGVVGNRVGQGLATEMGHAMLQLAFGPLRLHRVQAKCRAENQASRRIMAKLGMREEGVMRDNRLVRGEWWSTVQGAILSSDPVMRPADARIRHPRSADHGVQVLNSIDSVQRRPGMYIGDTTDGSGLHHMIDELLDLAIDEVVAGHCDRIEIVLNAGGSVTVRDNGRGIPTDIHPREGMSAAELIMTRLHASVFSEQNAQHRFGRLQGVGATVVNALSEALELRIWRDGNEYFMRFRRGHPEAPLAIFGDAGTQAGKPRRGTEISFLPSERYFTTTEFDFARIEHRLRELAALNAGVTIVLADARGLQKTEIAIRHHNPL